MPDLETTESTETVEEVVNEPTGEEVIEQDTGGDEPAAGGDAEGVADETPGEGETTDPVADDVYTLKITNMDALPHSYKLTALNNDQVEIDLDGPLELTAEQIAAVIVRLRIPKSAGTGVQSIELELKATDDDSISRDITAKAMMPLGIGNR